MEETPPPRQPNPLSNEDGNGVSSSTSSLVDIDIDDTSPSPMDNQVIVRLVLDFCVTDEKSLHTCSMVSRVWYDATRARWNARVGTLRLYPTEEQRNHEDEESMQINENIMNVEEFSRRATRMGDVLKKFPNHKYDLRYWDLQSDSFGIENVLNAALPVSPAQSWFWASDRLKYITHLSMHHCKVHGGNFTMFSEEFLKALPNLKYLKIIGADISTEAMNEIIFRYSTKTNYYEHPNLAAVHLEPLLPLEMAHRAFGVFNRSMTSLKSMRLRELRGEHPEEEYKIADFTPGRFYRIHDLMRDRPFDKVDVVEYTSANPDHRAFRNYPVHSGDGISSFPGTFEVFSGIIQKEIVPKLDDEDGDEHVIFKLDMYACPFSATPETRLCRVWDGRLNKISLWGNIVCSLGILRGMRNLKELTYNTSCFGNKVHRKKVLKFLKEDGEGIFHDNNPFGSGNQLQIRGDRISKCTKKIEGRSSDDYRRQMFSKNLPNPGRWDRPANVSGTVVRINRASNGSATYEYTSFGPEEEEIVIGKKPIGIKLRKLDIDFRFGDASSWKSLGVAFPNVVDLKGVIKGDDQLKMIRKTWPRLTRLVVGHGSNQLSPEVILKELGGLARLKEFEWRGCSCLAFVGRPSWKLMEEKLSEMEEKLVKRGVKLTLPWEQEKDGEMWGICLEKVFNDAMKSGMISESNLELLLSM